MAQSNATKKFKVGDRVIVNMAKEKVNATEWNGLNGTISPLPIGASRRDFDYCVELDMGSILNFDEDELIAENGNETSMEKGTC